MENKLLTVSGVHISFVFVFILKLPVGFLSTFRFHIQTSCHKLTRQVERGEEFEKERKASKTVSRTVMGIDRLKSKARPKVRDLDAFAICRVRYSSLKSLT